MSVLLNNKARGAHSCHYI